MTVRQNSWAGLPRVGMSAVVIAVVTVVGLGADAAPASAQSGLETVEQLTRQIGRAHV